MKVIYFSFIYYFVCGNLKELFIAGSPRVCLSDTSMDNVKMADNIREQIDEIIGFPYNTNKAQAELKLLPA